MPPISNHPFAKKGKGNLPEPIYLCTPHTNYIDRRNTPPPFLQLNRLLPSISPLSFSPSSQLSKKTSARTLHSAPESIMQEFMNDMGTHSREGSEQSSN